MRDDNQGDEQGTDEPEGMPAGEHIEQQVETVGTWFTTFRALRHRNYALFWSGQLISLVGTWMQSVAQGWLVLELVKRHLGAGVDASLYLGFVSAAGSTPMLLLSLFAGVAADRWPKRTIIIITQFALMVLALTLAFLNFGGHIRLWHVIVLASLQGIAMSFDMPSRQAFVKEMVGPEDLLNAIALNSSLFNGARVIGPAVAGWLIAIPAIGIGGAFLLNGISYLAVIGGLFAMRVAPVAIRKLQGGIWQHLGEGFRYVRGHRAISVLLLLMAIFSLFGFSYIVLMPVLARDILGAGAAGYGMLISFGGLGALVAALLLATMAGRIYKGSILLAGSLVCFAAMIGLGISRVYPLSAFFLALVSGGLVVSSSSINSLIQEIVPDALRGRVISMWTFVFAGFGPIGALYIGTVAHVTSVPTAFVINGIICLFAIAVLSLRAGWVWRLP